MPIYDYVCTNCGHEIEVCTPCTARVRRPALNAADR